MILIDSAVKKILPRTFISGGDFFRGKSIADFTEYAFLQKLFGTIECVCAPA
jgi:hypothetical protein